MTTMRDGSTVEDPRFGRLPQWDERNHNFPVRALFGAAPPVLRSCSWRLGIDPLNQGQDGSCVGHAFAGELAATPVVVSGITHERAVEIYYAAQQLDDWPGGSYPGASPVYEGTSVLAGAKALQQEGHYGAYRWALSESEMALAVSYKGPVVVGVNFYAGMAKLDRGGYAWPTGTLLGGHAFVVLGINVKSDDYLWANSWGTDWGNGGYARIKRSAMAQLLSENGECCLPTRVAKKAT